MARSPDPVDGAGDVAPTPTFRVRVGSFDGPFDLLLALIGKHELEITELSLSVVTDEFLSFLGTLDDDADLDQASGFLVVGATLLDLKLASLLPQGELVDAEDAALLEARDLLFARLLQYRAFKEATHWFEAAFADASRVHPIASRAAAIGVGERSPLDWTVTLAEFAALAERALAPQVPEQVAVDHLHAPSVSLREQAAVVAAMLRGGATVAFGDLVGRDAPTGIVVARFLAVLELYRHGAVAFDQVEPLGTLLVRWSAEHLVGNDWDDRLLDTLGRDWDE